MYDENAGDEMKAMNVYAREEKYKRCRISYRYKCTRACAFTATPDTITRTARVTKRARLQRRASRARTSRAQTGAACDAGARPPSTSSASGAPSPSLRASRCARASAARRPLSAGGRGKAVVPGTRWSMRRAPSWRRMPRVQTRFGGSCRVHQVHDQESARK